MFYFFGFFKAYSPQLLLKTLFQKILFCQTYNNSMNKCFFCKKQDATSSVSINPIKPTKVCKNCKESWENNNWLSNPEWDREELMNNNKKQ